jgi:hypothetical protein
MRVVNTAGQIRDEAKLQRKRQALLASVSLPCSRSGSATAFRPGTAPKRTVIAKQPQDSPGNTHISSCVS